MHSLGIHYFKEKCICLSIYRLTVSSNLAIFFEEINNFFCKAVLEYKNIILMGDFNINPKGKGLGFEKYELYVFNLTNLIKSETCFNKNHKSLIDLLFTDPLNKPLSFQKAHVTKTH